MSPSSSTPLKKVEWLRNFLPCCLRSALAVEEENRISDLPDHILSHILSFLPIKDAVRTSVLSRRWIGIWRFITSLNFDEVSFINSRLPANFNNLKNIVNEISSPVIHSFNLSSISHHCQYESLVHSWISSISERKVHKLYICYQGRKFNFLSILLECITLTEINLQLKHCFLFIVRSPIHHPTLQILRLTGIFFNYWSFSSFDVIFDFPLVKVFKLKECTFSNAGKLRIFIPRAKRFVFKQPIDPGVHSLCHSIELCAPSLTKLTLLLTASPLPKVIPPSPSSIENASIESSYRSNILGKHILSMCKPDEMHSQVCEHLQSIQAVKYLKLGTQILWVLRRYGENISSCLPKFGRLLHLEIDTSETKLGFLLNILHKSPFLESLVCKTCIIDEDYVASQVVPQCFAYHLMKVTVMAFNGGEADFHLAKYFLKNARILEQMKIAVVPWLWHSKNMMDKVEQRLSKWAMLSSHVEIEFLKHENNPFFEVTEHIQRVS